MERANLSFYNKNFVRKWSSLVVIKNGFMLVWPQVIAPSFIAQLLLKDWCNSLKEIDTTYHNFSRQNSEYQKLSVKRQFLFIIH
jgi:hypothetical protein